MATIRTAIELQDNFTNILYSVIDSVNLGLSAMMDLQQTMSAPVDTTAMERATASIEATRASINQATVAAQQLSQTKINLSASTAPNVEIPVTWQSPDFEVFTNSGIDRFTQEIAALNTQMQKLRDMQDAISRGAAATEVLTPQAQYDVMQLENRLYDIQKNIEQFENNSLDINADKANDDIERLRQRMSEVFALQERLNEAMEGGDLSSINSAYLQLEQNILNIERTVRDNFVIRPEVEQPEPVQVPIKWQSDNLEVFTGTVVERFTQEVQSANNMLNTLNQTQSRIAETAAQTDLFPTNAIADMNNMQARLQTIQQRIQDIENNPLNFGSASANAELEQLRGQLDQAVQEQQNLNAAVENMDVEAANQAYLRLSQTISGTERYIRDNVDEQGRFNREIEEGTNEANSLMQTIKGAVAAYATIQTLSAAMNLSDQLTSTTARLNMMNDGLQSTQDLQNMIYLSAERARGSYQATADAVSKLGLMAGDAFGSSEEIIAFMEQVNKQFTIAGTEAAGIDAAMLQLTQAMASGILRGEEYNSILEQAPNIIQAIADYLEVPKGQLKDMAAEGVITADIVKAAMFAAADETNAKFESMPKTFSQIWTSFQNNALMAFQPVLQRMNEIANSEAFQTFVNNAIEGLSLVAGVALEIFDLLVGVAGAVADNWSWLSPIIYGVAAALAVYYGWQLAVNAISATTKGIKIALCIVSYAHAAATGAEASATAAATAAQYGLNTAMYACPIVWIIVLIIALIALFYAAVAAVNHFAGTSVSATGIICGAFAAAGAFIWDLILGALELVLGVLEYLINPFINIANFIGNVFTSPISSIIYLFQGMADTALGILQTIASALDFVFGSSMADTIQGWRDGLKDAADAMVAEYAPNENYQEVMSTLDFSVSDLGLERISYSDAWNAGYSFGEDIDESIANFDPSSLFDTNVPGAGDYADLSGYGAGLAGDVGDIAGNTGAIKDSMDITEEDLKYLRDIAEQETVNRFTTAEITIEQTNHNTISGKMDLDGIVLGLTDAANEAINAITEGVHV